MAAAAQSDAPVTEVSNIVIVIAMQAEAQPVVNKFQLIEDSQSPFPQGVPWVRYHGKYKDLNLNLIWPGKDPNSGVDSVGTISSALVTYAAIQALKPDLIINAGTAGGFKARGASVGDIFIISDCAFHDRRIPIPVFDLYGVGSRKAFETPNLVKELNLKVGKLSTGDSLDMTQQDESSITANDATVKDMEGAAVAYVADLLKVPAIFVKAVTDIIDGEKPTAEEFLQNLASVTTALDLAVEQISNLTSSLKKNWPTLACPSGNGIQFWTHEWEKHGTCSESILKQHDYFETTLNLKQKSNLLDALTSAGIQADGGSYSLSSIKDAIEKGVISNLTSIFVDTGPLLFLFQSN